MAEINARHLVCVNVNKPVLPVFQNIRIAVGIVFGRNDVICNMFIMLDNGVFMNNHKIDVTTVSRFLKSAYFFVLAFAVKQVNSGIETALRHFFDRAEGVYNFL